MSREALTKTIANAKASHFSLLLTLFSDCCQELAKQAAAKLLGVVRKRSPTPRLSLSEVMTILKHIRNGYDSLARQSQILQAS